MGEVTITMVDGCSDARHFLARKTLDDAVADVTELVSYMTTSVLNDAANVAVWRERLVRTSDASLTLGSMTFTYTIEDDNVE